MGRGVLLKKWAGRDNSYARGRGRTVAMTHGDAEFMTGSAVRCVMLHIEIILRPDRVHGADSGRLSHNLTDDDSCSSSKRLYVFLF